MQLHDIGSRTHVEEYAVTKIPRTYETDGKLILGKKSPESPGNEIGDWGRDEYVGYSG